MKMYFEGMGSKDTVVDRDHIIWYFNQMSERLKYNKAQQTKYWLDLREQYSEALLKHEAYEILEFIKIKATDAKIKRRIAGRIKAKKIAELELKQLTEYVEQSKLNRELIKLIGLN